MPGLTCSPQEMASILTDTQRGVMPSPGPCSRSVASQQLQDGRPAHYTERENEVHERAKSMGQLSEQVRTGTHVGTRFP